MLKKKVEKFRKLSLNFLLKLFLKFFLDFCWELSLNVVENVAKVDLSFLFVGKCNFFTLINYSTNMC